MRSYAKWAIGAVALTCSALSFSTVDYRSAYPLPTTKPLDGAAVNVRSATVTANDFQAISQSGFKYVRMDLWWCNVEWNKGRYDFSFWDNVMQNAKASNLRVNFILNAGNPNYTSGLMSLPTTPAAQQAYINYAVACVSRYKGQGVLWEIFNEPDGSNLSASAYCSLAHRTAQAIRAVAPQEWILGPSISSISNPNALAYLQTCIDGGLLKDLDALSVHPYNGDAPETMGARFASLQSKVAKAGYRTMPIMATEWGYPVSGLPAALAPSAFQLGGSNLLVQPNTFTDWQWKGYYVKPAMTTVGIPDPVGGFSATRMAPMDSSQNPDAGFSGLGRFGPLQKGHSYTASVWLRSTGAPFTVYMGLNDCDKIGVVINSNWQRYSFTLVDRDKWNQGRMFQVWESTVGNPAWDIYGAQLEDNGVPDPTLLANSSLGLQGQFLVRSYQSCLSAGVPYTVLYEWKESPQAPGCGLNWSDMTPKPAMTQWKAFAGIAPTKARR